MRVAPEALDSFTTVDPSATAAAPPPRTAAPQSTAPLMAPLKRKRKVLSHVLVPRAPYAIKRRVVSEAAPQQDANTMEIIGHGGQVC